MKHKLVIILGASLVCLLLVGAARSEGISMPASDLADDFSISWWTVDAGGGRSQGSVFVLTGTLGQPDANRASGGNFVVTSGFWTGVHRFKVFSPLIRR